jgi:hypothetical protein
MANLGSDRRQRPWPRALVVAGLCTVLLGGPSGASLAQPLTIGQATTKTSLEQANQLNQQVIELSQAGYDVPRKLYREIR